MNLNSKNKGKNDWQKMPLSEAVLINPLTPIRKGEITNYVDMQSIEIGRKYVTSKIERDLRGGGSKFMNSDVLMARITPCLENGKIAQYKSDNRKNAHGSTEFIIFREKPGVTDKGFVYYLIKSDLVRNYAISNMTGTSGRQRVPVDVFDHLFISLPPIPEQQRIAQILGTLDDKIELNQRMNQTLEGIAQATFKSWFVDFDPVRAKAEGRDTGLPEEIGELFPSEFEDSEMGKIPKGWKKKPLDEIADYLNGLALQNFPPLNNDDYLPVIKIAQLRKNSTDGADRTSSKIDQQYIINDGDILFSWSGSLDVVIWGGGKGALNQHLFKVTSSKYPKWFYFFWVKHYLPEFQEIAAGKATTMGHIQRKHLSDYFAIVPSKEFINFADQHLSKILELIINNYKNSRSISRIFNLILPRLLRGHVNE
jgi:type I restriction enzyme S subunit